MRKDKTVIIILVILVIVRLLMQGDIMGILCSPAMIILVISCIYILCSRRKAKVKISKELDFSEATREEISYKNVEYYREIPCQKNIEKAYWVLYHYTRIEERNLKYGIIGAYILRWVKDNNIRVTEDNKSYKIDLGNKSWERSGPEYKLYLILRESASSNNILEKKEFDKWYKLNYKKLDKWFEEFMEYETSQLEKEGLIKNKIVSKELKEEAIKLMGLKRFLLNFSLMPERMYPEVELWEEYLIFAELLGIAKEVRKQFSELYPDFSPLAETINVISKELPNTYFNISMISYFIFSAIIILYFLGALILLEIIK